MKLVLRCSHRCTATALRDAIAAVPGAPLQDERLSFGAGTADEGGPVLINPFGNHYGVVFYDYYGTESVYSRVARRGLPDGLFEIPVPARTPFHPGDNRFKAITHGGRSGDLARRSQAESIAWRANLAEALRQYVGEALHLETSEAWFDDPIELPLEAMSDTREIESALADGDCDRYHRATAGLLMENASVLLPDVESSFLTKLHRIAMTSIQASDGLVQSRFLSDVMTASTPQESYVRVYGRSVELIDDPEQVQPPRDLAASFDGSAVILSWVDDANNEDGYMIQRLESGIFMNHGSTGENATYFEDWELAADATYSYRVKACNRISCSSYSNHAQLTVPSGLDTIPPGPIQDLFVGHVDETVVYLYWTSPGDDGYEGRAARYILKFALEPITDLNWDSAIEYGGLPRPFLAGNHESFRLRNLEPNTMYYFAMKAVDERGSESALSSVVRAVTSGSGGDNPSNAGWWGGFACPPDGKGLGSFVFALETYDEKLIAGGNFTTAAGFPANYVAAWNGSDWRPLGDGTDDYVRSMTVYEGDLIVGGLFDHAGGIEAPSLARWNGSDWTQVGGGTNGRVYALTVYDGDLIVGGAFSRAGDVEVSSIARWDGNEWHSLGTGVNNQVFFFTEFEGDLIVGGDFGSAGNVVGTSEIARWNQTGWQALGTGMDLDYVHAIIEFQGDLIAGGQFVHAGGVEASNIARWDGTAWHPIDQGIDYWVRELAVFQDELYIAGDFSHANGLSARRIVSWNGSEWSSLGSGLNGGVNALAVFDGKLHVGGNFTEAGEKSACEIARWVPTD